MNKKVPALSSLTAAAKRKAYRAIEDVHLAYYEKGGLRELEEEVAQRRGVAARHIFSIAQYASEHAEDLDEAIALFLAMCTYAEAKYKDVYEVQNLKEVLPTWAVFKSNILRGIREYELDPIEYRSEGAFRVAVQKEAEQKALPPPVKANGDLEHALQRTVQLNSLRTLIQQIIFECSVLRPAKTKDAESVLRETMDKLQPFVDQRKV